MKNKGFTLVELLAVVVILLAISVIAVSSISAAIERNKVKQNDAKIEIIISYAKLYYEEHKNSESDKCIEIANLGQSKTGKPEIDIECNLRYLPNNENNLAYKAALLLMDEFYISAHIVIKIKKMIPVAAGMAGGSADAAAVLKGVNKLFGFIIIT